MYLETGISAGKAVDQMRALADQFFLVELALEEPFQVLQFLRDELPPDEPSAEPTEEGGAPGESTSPPS